MNYHAWDVNILVPPMIVAALFPFALLASLL